MFTEEDLFYLCLAYNMAGNSKDTSTQNGAIIIHPDEPLTCIGGYNQFPGGVREIPFRFYRPFKYLFTEHAERNAIYTAARFQFPLEGATMYAPWFACSDCARAIIGVGIKRVVGHYLPEHNAQASWQDSINAADTMLEEAGVESYRYDGNLNAGENIRIGGVTIHV